MGVFSQESDDKEVKEKISQAIRQVETQRRELERLRYRLEDRRKAMFELTVQAIEKNEEKRAHLLASEHVELQKITRVVNASELALLHINVRLETIRDVGDIMYVLTNAFGAVKKIGKSVAEVAPNLELAAREINGAFTGILADLGMLSPNISISLSDTPTEIFNKAKQLISERTSELSELPKSIQQDGEAKESTFERMKKIAELATEEDYEELDSEEFRPVLYSALDQTPSDPEHAVKNYIKASGASKIDVIDASAQLNLPVDLVEQAYIKVLADKKFNATSSHAVKRSPNSAGT